MATKKKKKDLSRAAVAARAKAKGLKPTKAQIESTYRRNLLRDNKTLAYSSHASKAEVQKELSAIAERSKKKGKSPTRAQILATYGRNRARVNRGTNATLSGIRSRSRAKYGRSPSAAAVRKTYFNNLWREYLHPRGTGGRFAKK